MKVSNGNTIQKIYQEQVQKTKGEGSGDAFKKVMKEATPQDTGAGNIKKSGFHPPSGLNLANPVFSGKAVQEADPVATMKYAAEVVSAQPDIREERVNKLKSLIDSGKYNIPAELIADRIFQSGAVTKSWEA